MVRGDQEPELGFEPRTCCLQDSCSSQLSYPGGWHCSDGRSIGRCGLIVPTAHGPAAKRWGARMPNAPVMLPRAFASPKWRGTTVVRTVSLPSEEIDW